VPALLLIAAVLTTTCFRPRHVDCVLTCTAESGCPRGMACTDGYCSAGATCVLRIAAGEAHSCAVLAGRVKCWGRNASGQLGVGDREDRGDNSGEMGDRLPPVSLGTGRTVAAVALGGRHSCALLDRGDIKCWGDGSLGQLGQGDTNQRWRNEELGDRLPAVDLGGARTATALAAGLYHTCALLDGGEVKCWGDNRFGQLGIGAAGNRGDDPREMGNDLPAVDLGADDVSGAARARAVAIAAGAYHTCAVLAGSGVVKCWGWNDHGQLGAGDRRSRGIDPADMGVGLHPVPLGEGRKVADVTAGGFHTCALLAESGEVKCWGLNQAGQLGLGHREPRGANLAELGDLLPAVKLGIGMPARAITAGAAHTCALLADFSVRCWGLNASGELGIGSTANQGDDAPDGGDALPPVRLDAPTVGASRIAAGANHTCAVHGAAVTCWGANRFGRLGVGDVNNRGDSAPVAVAVDLGGHD